MCDRKIANFLLGQRLLRIDQFVFPPVGPAQVTLCTYAPRQDFPAGRN